MMKFRTGYYFLGLYLAYVLVLVLRAGTDDEGHSISAISRIAMPVIELGLAYMLVSGLQQYIPQRSGFTRGARLVLAGAAAFAIGSVYFAQTYSLGLSGNFISVLALENSAEGRLVRGWGFYSSMGVSLAWWLALMWHVHRSTESEPRIKRKPSVRWAAATTLLLVGMLWQYSANGDPSRLEAYFRQTPVSSLIHNVHRVYLARHEFDDSRVAADSVDLASAGAGAYPFERGSVYKKRLPFSRRNHIEALPNVIVIFTEGFSARFVDAYGGSFAGLTPNIDKLAARTMRVDNYFNHTAATYRGLQGQMVSGYPGNGGAAEDAAWRSGGGEQPLARTQYQSIPRLLGDAGYDTYFFSPHPDSVGLNALIRSLGFSRVYTLESALKQKPELSSRLTRGSLSDRDLFGELRSFLDNRESHQENRPFFVGLYNIGTHAFFDVDDDGVRYGDGSNEVLNRFHNYDAQLGKFIDAFFASTYAQNTILVFTADHATYPEPAYRDIAGSEFKPYFVDRIPLLIYDPAYALPRSYDAEGATSVDFAPTLLHLMGIKKAHNSFLGHSIFERAPGSIGFVAIGRDYFASDPAGVYAEPDVPAVYRAEFERRKAAVTLYYRLETQNRIFTAAP